MKQYKKHGKPWWRWVFGVWPFSWLWWFWNPLRIVNYKEGKIIKDIRLRKVSKLTSQREKQRRRDAGEAMSKCFTIKLIRSLDLDGSSN